MESVADSIGESVRISCWEHIDFKCDDVPYRKIFDKLGHTSPVFNLPDHIKNNFHDMRIISKLENRIDHKIKLMWPRIKK